MRTRVTMTTSGEARQSPRRPSRETLRGPGPPGLAALSILAAALLLTFAPGPAGAAASDEAAALAGSVADVYERSSSYRIEFTQESYWSLADSMQVTRGVLLARPPASVSIRYEDGGRIAANGESLWVYVPQTGQFFCSPMDADDVAVDPARLLRLYTPDAEEPFEDAPAGKRSVRLRPLNPSAEPARLTVTVDMERLVVTEIVARSLSGDRTTYRMLDTTFSVTLDPAEFRPRRPPGSELIRSQAPGAP
ncbi:MAG: outer membrane lipoprotein carrier protein LolA [Candidatus Eisenbacteria bacterium]